MKIIIQILFLSATVLISQNYAQTDRRPSPAELERWIAEDMEKESRANFEKLAAQRRPNLIEKFVGSGRWLVTLVSEGGLLGSVTLFAMNSDGKLLCGSDDATPILQDAPNELFSLAIEIADSPTTTERRNSKNVRDFRRFCNDCATESFVVHTRKSDKWQSTRFSVPEANSALVKLYEAIRANGGCKKQ